MANRRRVNQKGEIICMIRDLAENECSLRRPPLQSGNCPGAAISLEKASLFYRMGPSWQGTDENSKTC